MNKQVQEFSVMAASTQKWQRCKDLKAVGLACLGILNEDEGIVAGGCPASLRVEAEGGLVAVVVGGVQTQLLGGGVAPLTLALPDGMAVVDDKAILIPPLPFRADARDKGGGEAIHQEGECLHM